MSKVIALLVMIGACVGLIGCRADDRQAGRALIRERSGATPRGQMNPGDWPQAETGSPSAGVPPL